MDLKFKGIKIKIGSSIKMDIERIKLASELIQGKVPLMVDANQAYSRAQALQMARFLRDQDVFFFEEPVVYNDLKTLRDIEELGVRVAVGESVSSLVSFINYIEIGNVSVIEPDITKVGGIKQFLKIVMIADVHGGLFIPHNWSTHIATTATLSAMLVLPGLLAPLIEIDTAPNCLNEVFEGGYKLENGVLKIIRGRGLNISYDEDRLRRYAVTKPIILQA